MTIDSKNMVTCSICNISFDKSSSVVNKTMVCSEKCLKQKTTERIEKYKITRRQNATNKCEVCGKSMMRADSVMALLYVCSEECKKYRKEQLPKKIGIYNKLYYTSRGFTEEESIKIISNLQKQNCPRCVDYWLKLGFTSEVAKNKISDLQKEISKKNHADTYERQQKSPRSIQYWISRGASLDEATEQHRQFNDYSSLDYYVKKYGEEHGNKLCNVENNKRASRNSLNGFIIEYGEEIGTEKWLEKYTKRGFQSKIATRFFTELYNKLPTDIQALKIYFKGLTEKEYGFRVDSSYFFYDFVISDLKYCIEFNGSYWHADPAKYKSGDIIIMQGKNILVDDIWKHDYEKKIAIEQRGYTFRTVWCNSKKLPVKQLDILANEITSIYKESKNEKDKGDKENA